MSKNAPERTIPFYNIQNLPELLPRLYCPPGQPIPHISERVGAELRTWGGDT